MKTLLQCNAEETDTRMWLHVKYSSGAKKLGLSPDTDMYYIGLPLISNGSKDVISSNQHTKFKRM